MFVAVETDLPELAFRFYPDDIHPQRGKSTSLPYVQMGKENTRSQCRKVGNEMLDFPFVLRNRQDFEKQTDPVIVVEYKQGVSKKFQMDCQKNVEQSFWKPSKRTGQSKFMSVKRWTDTDRESSKL